MSLNRTRILSFTAGSLAVALGLPLSASAAIVYEGFSSNAADGSTIAINGTLSTTGSTGFAPASVWTLTNSGSTPNGAYLASGLTFGTGATSLVGAGQVVRVTGFARERFNQTTINGTNSNTSPVPAANVVDCGTGSVAHTDVSMPFPDATYLERFEGMLVRFPQPLVISEYFNYDRFGEMVLALPLPGEPRAFSPTALAEPSFSQTKFTHQWMP